MQLSATSTETAAASPLHRVDLGLRHLGLLIRLLVLEFSGLRIRTTNRNRGLIESTIPCLGPGNPPPRETFVPPRPAPSLTTEPALSTTSLPRSYGNRGRQHRRNSCGLIPFNFRNCRLKLERFIKPQRRATSVMAKPPSIRSMQARPTRSSFLNAG